MRIKNKKILIIAGIVLGGILFGLYRIVLARTSTYGRLEVHTSFANYFVSDGGWSGGWSNYPGVPVRVSGDGGSWYSKYNGKWYSCSTGIFKCPYGYGSKCDLLSEDTKFTDIDGWARWNYPYYGFQACQCTFYIDLPLNTSNAPYGGSWSRYLGFENPGCVDGVWPSNNNCYSLLTWSPPYWRFQTPKWGNENTYRPYFDWCENECPYQGATEEKTENGKKYQRTCGYYDKDTCYDWGPWELISQPVPVCLPLCGCRNINYSGPISASHFNQLRKDINNTEKKIKESIDNSFAITRWTDDPLKAGDKIRAVHINEMCSAVKRIENKLNTGTSITCRDNIKPGEVVESSHIKSICNDLNNIIDKWNSSHGC